MNIHVFHYDTGSVSGGGYIEHHEWELLERTVLREEVTVDVELNSKRKKLIYPYLSFIFMFQRKPEFFEKNVIMPTAMISALSTVAFLLPNESGEKITFSVTVFLAFCVNLLVVTNHVPASSESFPIIGHYYLFCIMIVAVSIFMTTIVLSFHFQGEHMHLSPIPPLIKTVMFNYVAPVLGFQLDRTLQSLYDKIIKKRSLMSRKRRPKFSTFETRRTKSNFSISAYLDSNDSVLLSSTKLNTKASKLPKEFQMRPVMMNLLKVETHLRDVAIENVSKHQRNITSEEWKILSRIVDRVSAIAYAIVTSSFTCYFMHAMRNKPLVDLPEPYFLNSTVLY